MTASTRRRRRAVTARVWLGLAIISAAVLVYTLLGYGEFRAVEKQLEELTKALRSEGVAALEGHLTEDFELVVDGRVVPPAWWQDETLANTRIFALLRGHTPRRLESGRIQLTTLFLLRQVRTGESQGGSLVSRTLGRLGRILTGNRPMNGVLETIWEPTTDSDRYRLRRADVRQLRGPAGMRGDDP